MKDTQEVLENQKKKYIEDINKLIYDFKKKKKEYYRKHLILCWLTTVVNAGLTLILGLSFIEEYETNFKIIALISSSLLIVLNSATIFLNYKNKYQQRTKTLVKLQILKRDFEMKYDIIDSNTLKDYTFKFESIMQDDLQKWVKNNPSNNTNIEER